MSKWKPCSKWPQKPVYLRQTLHLGGRELVMQAGKEESSLPLLLSWANLEKLRLVCVTNSIKTFKKMVDIKKKESLYKK